MDHKTSRDDARKDFSGYRSIRMELMIGFSCLTVIPFVVFAFIYFRLETLNIFSPAFPRLLRGKGRMRLFHDVVCLKYDL